MIVSLALQGLSTSRWWFSEAPSLVASTLYAESRAAPCCRLAKPARIRNRLILTATKSRKMVANARRKMQTPAYWPVLFGVKELVQSGVPVDVKKSISMDDVAMSSIEDIESPVADAGIVIDVVLEPMSMAIVELMSMSMAVVT